MEFITIYCSLLRLASWYIAFGHLASRNLWNSIILFRLLNCRYGLRFAIPPTFVSNIQMAFFLPVLMFVHLKTNRKLTIFVQKYCDSIYLLMVLMFERSWPEYHCTSYIYLIFTIFTILRLFIDVWLLMGFEYNQNTQNHVQFSALHPASNVSTRSFWATIETDECRSKERNRKLFCLLWWSGNRK